MRRPSQVLLLAVAPVLLVTACRKKPEPAPVAAPTPPAPAAPARPVAAPVAAPRDTMEEYRAKVAAARATLLETIYFEYDMDELRDDARASLEAKLLVLNANPQLRVRIAGHCDERGSDEYNIALGRRRAEAAKRYLVDRGVDEGRIETASFGRERPAVTGATEEAYSRNRRDEFEILAGGEPAPSLPSCSPSPAGAWPRAATCGSCRVTWPPCAPSWPAIIRRSRRRPRASCSSWGWWATR